MGKARRLLCIFVICHMTYDVYIYKKMMNMVSFVCLSMIHIRAHYVIEIRNRLGTHDVYHTVDKFSSMLIPFAPSADVLVAGTGTSTMHWYALHWY